MKKIVLLLLTLIMVPGAFAESLEERRARTFNLNKSGLALQGYDPVSYHQAKPQEGEEAFSTTYQGVRYHFASQANLKAFQADPAKYEPAYGGWCAWAMLDGEKVDVDPQSFKLIEGRVYVFYDGLFGDTLKRWNKLAAEEPEPALVTKADRHWETLFK